VLLKKSLILGNSTVKAKPVKQKSFQTPWESVLRYWKLDLAGVHHGQKDGVFDYLSTNHA
jgi:hypothetical protein